MRLIITGGTLEVKVAEGSLLTLEDVKNMLKKLSEAQAIETTENIKKADTSKKGLTSKSNQVGKLNAKPKLPI